ncbi:MAG: response regulator [Chloroflexi bacterium]|nr:response regulator [Chloroflexota bacterium]
MVARGRTLLVVDSDPNCVEALRPLLEKRVHRILVATSGQEGLRYIEREKPDVILLEAMLPDGLQGFHLVWQLRNHPDESLRCIPVVVATSLHSTTDLRLYPHLGDADYRPGEYLPVQDFLDKPVAAEELARRLETFLQD